MAPDARKKPGKPSGLPGFFTYHSFKTAGQNCPAALKRQFLMQAGRLSAAPLCAHQGNRKKLCAKAAFQGR
ncbi:MAG: hypothetical protein DBY17_07215 [Oscillospiraceae bacterium]|nr:MAG: hypothetical protein DBY17_07215 [Oscillospiraceae bacterium]